jgi:tetratricopeptide (TPR) repeat protein
MFLPFSIRKKEQIPQVPTLPLPLRENLLNRCQTAYEKDPNFSNEKESLKEFLSHKIHEFYVPKAYNKHHAYRRTRSLETFMKGTSPVCVFDVLEILYRHLTDKQSFEASVNSLLRAYEVGATLKNGYIELNSEELEPLPTVDEEVTSELLRKAEMLYLKGEIDQAIQALWDAFERIKTYFYPHNKKDSADKLIHLMSHGNKKMLEIFEEEASELTHIGNSCSIRHHEMNQVRIKNLLFLKYLYQRCWAFITAALAALQEQNVIPATYELTQDISDETLSGRQ